MLTKNKQPRLTCRNHIRITSPHSSSRSWRSQKWRRQKIGVILPGLVLVGGWTNSSEKYISQTGLSPQGSGWIFFKKKSNHHLVTFHYIYCLVHQNPYKWLTIIPIIPRFCLPIIPTLFMEEIPNNHLECIKPCKSWDKLPTSTGECRISEPSTGLIWENWYLPPKNNTLLWYTYII